MRVTRSDAGGKVDVIKAKLGPGEYFGEMALLSEEPRNSSVTTTSDTTVMKLDRKTFQGLMGSMNDIISREAARRQREIDRATRPTIKMADLRQLTILGVGTFGRVKLVLNTKEGNRPYALKCMRKGQVGPFPP